MQHVCVYIAAIGSENRMTMDPIDIFSIDKDKEDCIRYEKVEIAKNLIENNVNIDIIISSTKLTIEEIQKIKKDMK